MNVLHSVKSFFLFTTFVYYTFVYYKTISNTECYRNSFIVIKTLLIIFILCLSLSSYYFSLYWNSKLVFDESTRWEKFSEPSLPILLNRRTTSFPILQFLRLILCIYLGHHKYERVKNLKKFLIILPKVIARASNFFISCL